MVCLYLFFGIESDIEIRVKLQMLLHFREFLHQTGTAAACTVDAHQIHLVVREIHHIKSLSALFVCALFSLLDGAGTWSIARTEGFLPVQEPAYLP